jgi:glycosyltransferase involved in cell wall biosynthesis
VNGVTDVLRDGEDALLVSPGDAEALADAISAVARDIELRDHLRASAFARQRRSFSDTAMAAEVARIYHQVLVQKVANR